MYVLKVRSDVYGRYHPRGVYDGEEGKRLDYAISLESAKIKQINSPVAARANVLVVPDLEGGILLGARVPISLTRRADSVTTRLASCAVAALMARARRDASTRSVS